MVRHSFRLIKKARLEKEAMLEETMSIITVTLEFWVFGLCLNYEPGTELFAELIFQSISCFSNNLKSVNLHS